MNRFHFRRENLKLRYAVIALGAIATLTTIFSRETALGYAVSLFYLVAAIVIERFLAQAEKKHNAMADLNFVLYALENLLGGIDKLSEARQDSQNQHAASSALALIKEASTIPQPTELRGYIERYWATLTKGLDLMNVRGISSIDPEELDFNGISQFTETCENLRGAALYLLAAAAHGNPEAFSQKRKAFYTALTALNKQFVQAQTAGAPAEAELPTPVTRRKTT
jgi:hypothetical protein